MEDWSGVGRKEPDLNELKFHPQSLEYEQEHYSLWLSPFREREKHRLRRKRKVVVKVLFTV